MSMPNQPDRTLRISYGQLLFRAPVPPWRKLRAGAVALLTGIVLWFHPYQLINTLERYSSSHKPPTAAVPDYSNSRASQR